MRRLYVLLVIATVVGIVITLSQPSVSAQSGSQISIKRISGMSNTTVPLQGVVLGFSCVAEGKDGNSTVCFIATTN